MHIASRKTLEATSVVGLFFQMGVYSLRTVLRNETTGTGLVVLKVIRTTCIVARVWSLCVQLKK